MNRTTLARCSSRSFGLMFVCCAVLLIMAGLSSVTGIEQPFRTVGMLAICLGMLAGLSTVGFGIAWTASVARERLWTPPPRPVRPVRHIVTPDPAGDPAWLRANGMEHAAALVEQHMPPIDVHIASSQPRAVTCPICHVRSRTVEPGEPLPLPTDHIPDPLDDTLFCPISFRRWRILTEGTTA